MAVNKAQKFSPKVDERFKIGSVTEKIINQNYEWTGVDTVKVYSLDHSPLNDYNTGGSGDRYGEATEQGDQVQNMQLTQDKAFNITVDQRNVQETMQVRNANRIVTMNVDEVLIPYIDEYRITTLVTAGLANGGTDNTAPTSSNAWQLFLAGRKWLVNKKVPTTNRYCLATAEFINLLQQDTKFNLASDKAMEANINGFAGKAAGIAVIEVPEDYFPSGVSFVMTHPSVLCSPKTLASHITHKNPPGINGWKIEIREVFDAFVMNKKKDGIYVHKV